MGKLLAGQVALVTGGSRGIGRTVSGKLAELGATVVVNYASNAGAAEGVVTQIKSGGGQAEAVRFDVGSPEQIETSIKDIFSSHGRIDILVNNAGIARDNLIARTKAEDWQRTLDVNLSGCFFAAKAVLRPMLKQRSGRIINISSVIGEMGNAGQVAYASSKAGVFGLTKSLAREVGSRGITVNAITPGYIETDMTGDMSDAQREAILSSVVLGRLGQPEDIAETVAFLASPGAGYITGQILGVNGGLYM